MELISKGSFEANYSRYPSNLWTPAGTFHIKEGGETVLVNAYGRYAIGKVIGYSLESRFVIDIDSSAIDKLLADSELFGFEYEAAEGLDQFFDYINNQRPQPTTWDYVMYKFEQDGVQFFVFKATEPVLGAAVTVHLKEAGPFWPEVCEDQIRTAEIVNITRSFNNYDEDNPIIIGSPVYSHIMARISYYLKDFHIWHIESANALVI